MKIDIVIEYLIFYALHGLITVMKREVDCMDGMQGALDPKLSDVMLELLNK